ncbi:uncharacterized protein LOC101217539 [Cucumis sativus]|uniref:Zeta toxin domain-containing protein n=1 Tax=Cucumis sativus TaxID=3659 RepID=A0A0A0LKP6_CUCSA|nr:uncharacterized protein LOC101217539 [Cucumis sativus]KGN61624.1 hypothetical protein Csa_006408 [Cucumis sativus]
MKLPDLGGNGGGIVNQARMIAVSLAGVVAAAGTHYHWGWKSRSSSPSFIEDQKIVPVMGRTESGRAATFEAFPDYVARQLGFKDAGECPKLGKLINDYLKKKKGCEEWIYDYLVDREKDNADSLYVKLIQELETCILTYFAFHWDKAPQMVSQALTDESEHKTKLKSFIMAATRKRRFERVTKDLKVTRVISTLVEEIKAIGGSSNGVEADSKCTDVMAPVALNKRSPVLLLMGGGMGAGKSTVTKDILKEPFWLDAEPNAVVVEADAFKESDVVYKAINSMGCPDDMLQTSELVHQSSTDAASSLLVTALNEGRDVIMDGTLAWEPYVNQTIEMARNVHKHRYRMGVGYKVNEDGTVIENYWEQVSPEEEEQYDFDGIVEKDRKPYRIELVGVVCDAHLAVIRGIRRAVMVGRAVRVNSQLKSHKRFSEAFPRYCDLVDNARLYSTNVLGISPKLIGWKDGDNKLLVDPEEIKCVSVTSKLNENANSVYELYQDATNVLNEKSSIWKETVLSSSRPSVQMELKASIQSIESK